MSGKRWDQSLLNPKKRLIFRSVGSTNVLGEVWMTRTVQLHLIKNKEVFAHLNSGLLRCTGLGSISSIFWCLLYDWSSKSKPCFSFFNLHYHKPILGNFSFRLFLSFMIAAFSLLMYHQPYTPLLMQIGFIYSILYSWYAVQSSRNSSSAWNFRCLWKEKTSSLVGTREVSQKHIQRILFSSEGFNT